jgi:C4-dicarboxylate-specific signal transduction histidine kinase
MDALPSLPSADAQLQARTEELLAAHQRANWLRADRLFLVLLALEWLACVVFASYRSPRAWEGAQSSIHPHVWTALLLGAVIVSLPIALVLKAAGTPPTRHAVAVAQMLMSALLIHVGDGRIEMHFHVFGSFAFLAFYRDWRVLVTGVVVIAGDHLLRGMLTPESVYGDAAAGNWRTLEHAAWVLFENVFLIFSCVQGVREMRGVAEGQALLERSYRDVEDKVEQRTRELKAAQDDLLRSARSAGMAEIATSVLHNVGNVLNSVNVSATLVTEKLKHSEVGTLADLSALMVENRPNLGAFLTTDERGQMIPDFISQLATCLSAEQEQLLTEVASLSKGVDHIKSIVAAQQSMAKSSNVRTLVEPSAVIETALKIGGASHASGLVFEKHFEAIGPVELDQHKVLQILINIISNARQAVANRSDAHDGPGRIILTISSESGRVRFSVKDNGIGIAAGNLARVFSHGFTTKKEGHGFGLHSAANAAREMNGSLTVASEGVGKGATFTLDVPYQTELEESTCR